MNKICILGNSHVGSIKKAFSEMGTSAPINANLIDFYASPAASMINLELNQNILFSTNTDVISMMKTTSGGSSEIEIKKYSSFLIVGFFSIGPHLKLQSLKKYYSSAVYEKAFDSLIRETVLGETLFHIINLIYKASNKIPIYIIPTPFKAKKDKDVYYEDYILKEVYKEYINYFEKYGVRIIKQPYQTLDGSFYTKSNYLKDGLNFNRIDNENNHANAEYGKFLIQDMLAMNIFNQS
jgi:hypothetical protein